MAIAINALFGFAYGLLARHLGLGKITDARWWLGFVVLTIILVSAEKALGI